MSDRIVDKLGVKTCLVCKRTYIGHPALSRKDNKTEICPSCGLIEAVDVFEDCLDASKDYKRRSMEQIK